MSVVSEVVEDFDAAVSRIAAAEDVRMQRRAVREALGHLYTLREHRKAGLKAYHAVAAGCADGVTTEFLMLLRAALVHQITKPVAPELRDQYSNTYTNMYGAPVWLRRSEMCAPPKTLTSDYDRDLAGRDVFGTLQEARRFLLNPAVLGPLT